MKLSMIVNQLMLLIMKLLWFIQLIMKLLWFIQLIMQLLLMLLFK